MEGRSEKSEVRSVSRNCEDAEGTRKNGAYGDKRHRRVRARHGTSPSDRRTGLAFSRDGSDERAREASEFQLRGVEHCAAAIRDAAVAGEFLF
jgi:hypothetical protein